MQQRHYVKGGYDNTTIENPTFETFGSTKREKQTRYGEFLLNFDSRDAEQYKDLDRPVGNEHFKQRLVKKQGRYFPRRQGRIHKKPMFVL